jgi:DNA-directed RNA polymerase specialized sigma24 family protein
MEAAPELQSGCSSSSRPNELMALIRATETLPLIARKVVTLRKVYGYAPTQIERRLRISSAEVEAALMMGTLAFASVHVPRWRLILGRALLRPSLQTVLRSLISD